MPDYFHVCPSCGTHVNCDGANLDKVPPFTHPQFFIGALHAIGYMTEAASDTQGARVWAKLFEVMRTNLIMMAKEKGMELK